jgi:arylsulfatase A-like enzyme
MDRALSFIGDAVQADKPFLATVWFYGPHSPVRAGKELRDLYPGLPLGKQHYYGSITSIDREVGRLRAALKKLGVERNTLIFFCSDNGPEGSGRPPAKYTPYHGAYHGSAGQFRGRKRYLYNGGVCVPAFAYWPEVIKPGRTVAEPACVLDYVPTLNAITGYTMPDDRPLDGVSLLPMLNGKADWQRNKAIPFATQMGPKYPEVTLIRDGYKYCGNWNEPQPRDELYHLADDPGEQSNLATKQPERTRAMKAQLLEWVESCRRSYAGKDYPEPYTPQGQILPETHPTR